MNDDSVAGKVNAVIASVLGVEENKVLPHARLREELGASDLDVRTLMLTLEDELDMEFDVAGVRLVTVGDVIDYCEAAWRARRA